MSPNIEKKAEEGASFSGSSLAARRSSLALCALCPLLAVSDTVVNAIGLGIAVLVIAPLSASVFALARRWLQPETRLAGALLLFGGVTACLELLLRAYFFELHDALGVFLPLVAANIALVGPLVAADRPPTEAVVMVVRTSIAIALMLLALGVARELVGRGSLLHDAGLIFGQWARVFEMKVFRVDMGFLLGMLPPGAFISLGLLIAARNWLGRKEGEV